jgi:hypothetical protein
MMNDMNGYFGLYYFMGLVLDVKQIEDQLVAAVPGVPDGYEIILEPAGEDSFLNRGGPIDGSILTFTRNEAGEVTSIRAGQFELMKVNPDDLEKLPVMERILVPEFVPTPEKSARFEDLFQFCLERANGSWVDYNLPYPKYEFVQHLTEQDVVIFHGSNNTDINTFQPVRKSMELMDETGRGNIAGVYGTHDGLWAMFFAVIDREKLKGSIRNGVMYFQDRDGGQLPVYNFSINQDQLAVKPVTEGALYLLPRETFRRLKLTENSFTNEWASEKPIKPYAKLRLQSEDFPFLDQIDGHDDSELLRLGAISQEIRESAKSASLDGDRFEIMLPSGAEVAAQLDEYISLQKVMMPAAGFEIIKDADFVKLVVTSLPPAISQIIGGTYKELLNR